MSAVPLHRSQLPQLEGAPMLADGGIETTLIFHDGIDLRHFASFTLLDSPSGRAALLRYFESYVEIAGRHGAGIVLESATWRANADWGAQLGYGTDDLARCNRQAIEMLAAIRDGHREVVPIVISGCIGPQGDGYAPELVLSPEEAEAYHAAQIGTFAGTAADMVTAMTLTYAEEAIGVVRAARAAGMPVAIGFTVETDGRLPSGEALGDAILRTDRESSGGADYYMINCAHPTHFEHVLEPGAAWVERIRGLRANASELSHAELDEATELDAGDPDALAAAYLRLQGSLPAMTVLGGCCGTDQRHIDAIARACVSGNAA